MGVEQGKDREGSDGYKDTGGRGPQIRNPARREWVQIESIRRGLVSASWVSHRECCETRPQEKRPKKLAARLGISQIFGENSALRSSASVVETFGKRASFCARRKSLRHPKFLWRH